MREANAESQLEDAEFTKETEEDWLKRLRGKLGGVIARKFKEDSLDFLKKVLIV